MKLREALNKMNDDQSRELASYICWSGMEAYIDTDGYIGYRERGSRGDTDIEDEILGTLNLAPEYWRDSLIEWGLYDEDEDGIKADADWEVVRDFIIERVLPEFKDVKRQYPGEEYPEF